MCGVDQFLKSKSVARFEANIRTIIPPHLNSATSITHPDHPDSRITLTFEQSH
jgi:hypothetical protein